MAKTIPCAQCIETLYLSVYFILITNDSADVLVDFAVWSGYAIDMNRICSRWGRVINLAPSAGCSGDSWIPDALLLFMANNFQTNMFLCFCIPQCYQIFYYAMQNSRRSIQVVVGRADPESSMYVWVMRQLRSEWMRCYCCSSLFLIFAHLSDPLLHGSL
jgi:hypothetical protein